MIIDFIGKHIRLICLAFFVGLTVTAASMYWNLPERWRSPGTKSATQISYSCPMHPDVTSRKPGNCPRCGMTLKAVFVKTADTSVRSKCVHAGGGCCGTPAETDDSSPNPRLACPYLTQPAALTPGTHSTH